jgi:hypothetical protein
MVMIGLWGYPGSTNLDEPGPHGYEERYEPAPFLLFLRFLRSSVKWLCRCAAGRMRSDFWYRIE